MMRQRFRALPAGTVVVGSRAGLGPRRGRVVGAGTGTVGVGLGRGFGAVVVAAVGMGLRIVERELGAVTAAVADMEEVERKISLGPAVPEEALKSAAGLIVVGLETGFEVLLESALAPADHLQQSPGSALRPSRPRPSCPLRLSALQPGPPWHCLLLPSQLRRCRLSSSSPPPLSLPRRRSPS